MKFIQAGLFLSAIALAPLTMAQAQDQTPAQREVELLADYRKNADPYVLEQLADTREEQGKMESARATWALMLKKFGSQKSMAYVVSPTDKVRAMTYSEMANWKLKRLDRKRNLARNPVSAAQKGAASRAEMRFDEAPPVKYREATRAIDLDGDGIMEIVLYGRSGPLGEGKRNSVGIYKFDGQSTYRPIWRARQMPVDVVYHDYNKDDMKDGFAEIMMVYTRNSDDVAGLSYNGSSFMAYSSI